MHHYQTYNVWIKTTRATQNTDTVYFQHAYITKLTVKKADIVEEAATKLIKAIKGNYAAVHNETELDALNQLSQAFLNAIKKLSGIEIETAPEEQVPRVKKSPTTQNTQKQPTIFTEPPPMVLKEHDNLPHLIPADDSNDETSNGEMSTDDGDDHYEPTLAYHTHTQAAKHKTFHSNVTHETILSAVEMLFEQLNPARLA
jgi:hypothetical protein